MERQFQDTIPWESIRERIQERIDDRKWSRSRLAREAGMPVSTLHTFMSGQNRSLGTARLDALEKILGLLYARKTTNATTLPSAEEFRVRIIPVVNLERVRPSKKLDLDELSLAATDWLPVQLPGSGVHAAAFSEPLGGCLAGDIGIFSPHILPRSGDIIEAQVKKEIKLGVYQKTDKSELLELSGGQKVRGASFKTLSVLVECRRRYVA